MVLCLSLRFRPHRQARDATNFISLEDAGYGKAAGGGTLKLAAQVLAVSAEDELEAKKVAAAAAAAERIRRRAGQGGGVAEWEVESHGLATKVR
eukprot:SAG22_NODE_7232_length_759_cov_1.603030_1_plen_94_part_00